MLNFLPRIRLLHGRKNWKLSPFEASISPSENRVSRICRIHSFGIGGDDFYSKLDFLENETSNEKKKKKEISDLFKRAQ